MIVLRNIYREILDYARKKGYVDENDLREKFKDVDIEIIMQQMVDLGYIEYASNNCSDKSCSFCSLNKSCPYKNTQLKYYRIKKVI